MGLLHPSMALVFQSLVSQKKTKVERKDVWGSLHLYHNLGLTLAILFDFPISEPLVESPMG